MQMRPASVLIINCSIDFLPGTMPWEIVRLLPFLLCFTLFFPPALFLFSLLPPSFLLAFVWLPEERCFVFMGLCHLPVSVD